MKAQSLVEITEKWDFNQLPTIAQDLCARSTTVLGDILIEYLKIFVDAGIINEEEAESEGLRLAKELAFVRLASCLVGVEYGDELRKS